MPEILNILQSKLFEKSKCIINDEILNNEKFFDDFLLDKNYDFVDEILNKSSHLPKLNLDLNKLSEYFEIQKSNESLKSIVDELKRFNKYFETFLSSIDLEHFQSNSQVQNTFYFLFYFANKALFYILLHPEFSLYDSSSSNLLTFFENYRKIKHYSKLCLDSIISTDNNISDPSSLKKGYVTSFSDIINYKEKFGKIVSDCQNFLALILFTIGSNNSENEQEEILFDKQYINMLENFVKIFKTLYMINDEYKLIEYKEFYNDSFSKYLNFQRECKIYNQILNKKYEGKKPFCLISYKWLFDAAAKNDILQIFNGKKQIIEILKPSGGLNGLLPFPRLINIQNAFFLLNVNRNNLIEDTLNAVSNPSINLQKPLKVKFVNEQGVDEGGVKKEFFLLLVRQLFDANYGMFNYNEKTRLFWFNMYSFEPKIKFELIGIILGLALFNNVILDIKFPLVIYKKLLDYKPDLQDMKECDPELFNTFTYLKNTKDDNLKEKLSTTFTITNDKFGEKIVIPLKENGENIYIDNTNKDEYVDLYLDWYFNKSIEEYFKYFKNGFFRVCDKQLSPILLPEELELIICGTQVLNFHELKRVAKYEDGYKKDSLTIKYFWDVLFEFSEEEKKKFLFFVTGCDRAPINGLGSLIITVSRWGPDSDKLPTAHTCFNHLLIPDYQNKDKLKKNLTIAISNSEGFGLV